MKVSGREGAMATTSPMKTSTMITQSHRQVTLSKNGASLEVELEDIASSLSYLCRFGGHPQHFYSVAEHCLNVERLYAEHHTACCAKEALACLLHDAEEAYIGDIPSPVKTLFEDELNELTRVLRLNVFLHFGITEDTWSAGLRKLDRAMTVVEGYSLVGGMYWQNAFLGAPKSERDLLDDAFRVFANRPNLSTDAFAAYSGRVLSVWKTFKLDEEYSYE